MRKMDLSNQRFGRLTVIGENSIPYRSTSSSIRRRWNCLCDCGKQVTVLQDSLTAGRTNSCGCMVGRKAAEQIRADGNNILGRFEGTMVSHIIPSKKLSKANTSGIRGVCWNKRTQKWHAQIGVQGRVVNLGDFMNIEDAKKARTDAEEKYFAPIIERWNEEQKKKEGDLAC